jgi:hypothetical protein
MGDADKKHGGPPDEPQCDSECSKIETHESPEVRNKVF